MRSLTPSTFLVLSLIPACFLGCGAQPPLSEEDSASVEWSEQTIPLDPVSEHPFNLGAVGLLSEDKAELRFEGTVNYAFGDGYPTTIKQMTGGERWTGCASQLRGRYTPLSVEGSSEAVGAKLDAAGDLVVTLRAEGSASLTVKGEYEVAKDGPECGFAPGSRVPMTDLMVVHARRPTQLAVQFSDCYDAPVLRVATNVRLFPDFSLVDKNGELFQPRNANPRRPAALSVRSVEPLDPVQLSAPNGPGSEGTLSLTAPDTEGLFELRAPFGSPVVIEVVGPQRVSAEVQFGIELKTWAAIESGDTVDMHWAEAIQVLTLEETVEGTKLCSALDDAWFTLEGDSPKVCEVKSKPSPSPWSGHRLTDAAVVYSDGECRLKLTAPQLGGGVGLRRELTVQVNKP